MVAPLLIDKYTELLINKSIELSINDNSKGKPDTDLSFNIAINYTTDPSFIKRPKESR